MRFRIVVLSKGIHSATLHGSARGRAKRGLHEPKGSDLRNLDSKYLAFNKSEGSYWHNFCKFCRVISILDLLNFVDFGPGLDYCAVLRGRRPPHKLSPSLEIGKMGITFLRIGMKTAIPRAAKSTIT